jgi:DNA polymerase-3 subunit epsilon
MDLNLPLDEYTYVAFDTETSGAYPVGHDIVEFGAVKWYKGQEIGRLQFLLKPREPMTDFIIGIHGITNDMVADAPLMSEKIREIHEFFKGAVVMAHHAPFDLGFVALDFELNQLPLPLEPAICTSLLSRRWILDIENHKLQTLVKHLQIDGGQAHRAYDDAKACLQVALACFAKMKPGATLADVLKGQGKDLSWKNYSLLSANQDVQNIMQAIRSKKKIDMVYQNGPQKGEVRTVDPIGIVRNPDGDYLMATCMKDNTNKRYYLTRIKDVVVVY